MNDDLPTQSREFLQKRAIHSDWESDYLNPDMDLFWDVAFADILNRIKPQSTDTILDAGCGYCYHTARLARSGAKITAVDFSASALESAKDTISRLGLEGQVTLQRADLTNLTFPDATFDFVVCNGVLMHIPELEKALAELARVLRPGGTMVLNENNMSSLDVRVRERIIGLLKSAMGRNTDRTSLTPRGIETWKPSTDSDGLMVRKTDMKFLAGFLRRQGLREIARTPSQFTEAYTNVPTKVLKRLIYSFNIACLRRNFAPTLSMGNFLYFVKD